MLSYPKAVPLYVTVQNIFGHKPAVHLRVVFAFVLFFKIELPRGTYWNKACDCFWSTWFTWYFKTNLGLLFSFLYCPKAFIGPVCGNLHFLVLDMWSCLLLWLRYNEVVRTHCFTFVQLWKSFNSIEMASNNRWCGKTEKRESAGCEFSFCSREEQNLTPCWICFFYFDLCFPLLLFCLQL